MGDAEDASHLAPLKDLGIEYIVNATSEEPNHFPDEIKYLNIQIEDQPGADLAQHFDRKPTCNKLSENIFPAKLIRLSFIPSCRCSGIHGGGATNVVKGADSLRDGHVQIADHRHFLSHGHKTVVSQQIRSIC